MGKGEGGRGGEWCVCGGRGKGAEAGDVSVWWCCVCVSLIVWAMMHVSIEPNLAPYPSHKKLCEPVSLPLEAQARSSLTQG